MKKQKITPKFFPNLKPKTRNPQPNQGELGFSMVTWVIIVVFIFSVLIVTGSFSLEGTKATYRTLTPTPVGGVAPTTGVAPAAKWELTYTLGACEPEDTTRVKKGTITATGSVAGYIQIQVESSTPGTFTNVGTSKPFVATSSTYDLTLRNYSGFNTKKWQLLLYSGGTKDASGIFTGGKLETTKGGDATGC